MTNLNDYQNDGANHQARAVLALLQGFDCIVESSWNDERKKYDAEPKVARWENCREQGYVISMRAKNHKQLNIAFFEHRNSDSICAVMWEQPTLNSPTIDTAEFGDVYKDKYDLSHEVGWKKVDKMSNWIEKELNKFWKKNLK